MYACMYVILYVCNYACMYKCIYANTYVIISVCMFLCMTVLLYVCVLYVCNHVCMNAWVYIWMNWMHGAAFETSWGTMASWHIASRANPETLSNTVGLERPVFTRKAISAKSDRFSCSSSLRATGSKSVIQKRCHICKRFEVCDPEALPHLSSIQVREAILRQRVNEWRHAWRFRTGAELAVN